MYYIYHIPGEKIGCTSNLEKRMSDQGFTEWEILETYEDGWIAGDREIELQKEYGYKVDTIHYMISVQNRRKGGIIGGRNSNRGRLNVENGHWATISKLGKKAGANVTNSIRKACPNCGYESTPAGIYHHLKNCETKTHN